MKSKNWVAGCMTLNGTIAATHIGFEKSRPFPVTKETWNRALEIVKSDHGPETILLSLTPLAEPMNETIDDFRTVGSQ